jgi:REP element-mobilizing transposase RayT
MANTYHSLYVHVVFSTKRREHWLGEDIRNRVWAYIGGIARDNGMAALAVGGMADHVHVLLKLPPTQNISRAVQLIKGGSSKWIHETFPSLRKFRWQDGYGAFTVCRGHVDAVVQYIKNQKEHHRAKTFQEEYLRFLSEYRVSYDQRYVWD